MTKRTVNSENKNKQLKMKLKLSDSSLVQKKKTKKTVKVERKSIPAVGDKKKDGDSVLVKVVQPKTKRKSPSIKDLEVISNIMSPVKKPQKKFSKVEGKSIHGSEKTKNEGVSVLAKVEEPKTKRKSSTIKPIANIKALVKKPQRKLTKVEGKSIDGAEKTKNEGDSVLAKVEEPKTKRKSPTMKPIANIKSLVKKPQRKLTKVEGKSIHSSEKTQNESDSVLAKVEEPKTKRKSSTMKTVANIKSLVKKPQRKLTKVEGKNIPAAGDKKKAGESVLVKVQQPKTKRKSSKIKNLKPISNIKSLVKKPQKKLSKAQLMKRQQKFPERGVCYFSHIPHGFYEKQLKEYCSQFGTVTGVYHPVSKNGNSRGYAFVEFQHKEVAEVVADTMNNYLMFNRLVKCEYVPPEAQKPWVFREERDNKKEAILKRKENLKMQTRSLTKDEVKKWKKRRLSRVNSLHKKLAQLGADYEFQVNDTSLTRKTEESA